MIFAQISDLHIKAGGALAYGAADTLTALEKTVAHINRLVPAPEFVMITGDITDDGSPAGYKTARAALARLTPPFFMVPGNHDNKAAMAMAFPDHTYLSRALEDSRHGHACYSLDRVRPGLPLEILGLDTVFDGEHGGGLDQSRLKWLDNRLASAPDRPALIFMHHPPFVSGIGHMDKEPFARRRELAGLIRQHPRVMRLACGHIHRSIFTRFAGTDATVCPGIGMQLVLDLSPEAPSEFIMEPAGVMIHKLVSDWDQSFRLLAHVSIVADHPNPYGPNFPFY